MALSDTFVRTVKPQAIARRYYDEKALYLEVSPTGGKLWRFKYRFAGKEKRIAFGQYPDVGLRDARNRRDEARKLLERDIDPGVQKKKEKIARIERAESTFELVAREFLSRRNQWAPSHLKRVKRMLERDIFPKLRGRAIAEITAAEVLRVLRPIESRAPETAARALGICGQVFRYGVSTQRCLTDPTINLRGSLTTPESGHFAATTDPKQLGQILRAFAGYEGSAIVRCALNLAPLLFVRPGELRQAEWKNINLEQKKWEYIVSKTKRYGVREHIVPLAEQAVRLLEELQPITDNGRFVFPD